MEITLLKEEDVWGDSALEVIQAYGTRTGISDAAIVLGACRGSGTKDSIGVPSGLAWSASSSEIGLVRTVDLNGSGLGINPNKREAAGRPALLFPATSAIRPNNIKIITLQNGKTVQICSPSAYTSTH